MSKEFITPPDYKIYPTTPDDVEAINSMHNQVWLETYPNEAAGVSKEWVEERIRLRSLPESIEKRKAFIAENMNNPAMISRIAKNPEGEVIGMTHGYMDEEGRQNIGSIYVAKDYQGKGVATELIQEVIAWSDPSKPLYLGVASYNDRAKAFYRKHGFVEIEGSERKFAEVIPEIEMIRKGDKQ